MNSPPPVSILDLAVRPFCFDLNPLLVPFVRSSCARVPAATPGVDWVGLQLHTGVIECRLSWSMVNAQPSHNIEQQTLEAGS